MTEQLSRTPENMPQNNQASLLLVDDDQLITESLGFILKKNYQVHIAETRAQAKEIIASLDQSPQLALVDLGLPPYPHQPDEGFSLIEDLLAVDPQMKILVLSGQSEEANMHHALTLGAVDFVPKPADPALLQTRLQHHLMLKNVENQRAKNVKDSAIIGDSAPMKSLRQQIKQFCSSIFPVLIEGESGTGKELIAKALHDKSERSEKPYLVINCAAISPELLESQLFGHAKGSFTGASSKRNGFFSEAKNGTLFLDEVGEIPVDLQAKLLRVLESGEFYRVGETECQQSEARIIAASNRVLADEVKAGNFRSDLFHRLSILKIQVPALRERDKDSALLRMHFQNLYEGSIKHFSLNSDAAELWLEYGFPGNVRELRNVVIRLGTKHPGKIITRKDLVVELETDIKIDNKKDLTQTPSLECFNDDVLIKELKEGDFVLDDALNELESHCINIAMGMYDGNLSKVAKALHINRTTLYSRIQKNVEKGEN
jgi:DNA-binding NtrC family response regulator